MQSRRLVLAVLVAALGVAVGAPAADAKTPCWKLVIADWSKDGVINGHYSAKCLRTAIKKTPEDLRDYSGITDDINAALIDSTGVSMGKNGGGPGGSGGGPGSQSGGNGAALTPAQKAKRLSAARKAVPNAGTAASDPGHDSAVPLPLILLGALVLAGALAAAAPALYKQFRGRFPRLRPPPGSVRPPA